MNQRARRLFFILALVALLATVLEPVAVLAQQTPSTTLGDFDANYILSDTDLVDYTSMSQDDIQNFLLSKQSALATYVEPLTSLSASRIIYQTAQNFQINPKLILAMLQKEQSLVETPQPSQYDYDWAAGFAVCDGCDVNDPAIQKFKGFYNQVFNMARRIRQDYLPSLQTNGQTVSGVGPGITKLIDNTPITPANFATAILYTYTPHLSGNHTLWMVWNRYFTRLYPDGSLISVEGSKDIWLIQNGQRKKFLNQGVFLSRYNGTDQVLTVNQTELSKYPEGSVIRFPNYSYLKVPKGTVYLLVDDTLRGFASREALRQVGVNPEEIIKVKASDIADFAEGQPITPKTSNPLGTLMQDKKTGGVYWVQDGTKHAIWSREILKANFLNHPIQKATAAQLAKFSTGSPVLFPDGRLVQSKTDPTVYLITNKQRRPFASAKALTELGYDAQNVIVTSDESLGLHALGAAIPEIY